MAVNKEKVNGCCVFVFTCVAVYKDQESQLPAQILWQDKGKVSHH